MDSITQIVLGAACGEAVLGKKIGNKALLFGAIGGTIPDLDVYIGSLLYNTEIEAMAFHRGIMHSVLFAVLGAFIFGWIVFKFYDKGKRQDSTTLKDWIQLFFWSLFTHPILDSFTPYGTQLFAPFSDFRVALNTISVADPIYTLPFLISIIVLMFFNRKSSKRRKWLKLGLGISTAYLLLTVGNKFYMNTEFEKSLKLANIEYIRYRAQPTILNNILWYAIAETKDGYYAGYYSLLDTENKVTNWKRFTKNHEILSTDNPNIALLSWFSDGYYSLKKSEIPDEFVYEDLRYGSLNTADKSSKSIFSFRIFKLNDKYDAERVFDNPPTTEDLKAFFKRIKGI